MLRSAIFNTIVYSWTVLAYFLFWPALLLSPVVLMGCIRFWIKSILVMQKRILKLSYEFRGLENLPQGPFIVASAHQSAWETIAFFAIFPEPCYVMKQEYTRIPMFPVYLRRTGMIAVDRSGRVASTRKMLTEADAALKAGRPIVIFPSGTRLPAGQPMKIHSGARALWRRLGVPVVPVSLNSGVYWGRRSFVKKPGKIIVEFGEPLLPGTAKEDFDALLANRINAGNERLLSEARA